MKNDIQHILHSLTRQKLARLYEKDRDISIWSWSGQIGSEKSGLVVFCLKRYTVLYSLQYFVCSGQDLTNWTGLWVCVDLYCCNNVEKKTMCKSPYLLL